MSNPNPNAGSPVGIQPLPSAWAFGMADIDNPEFQLVLMTVYTPAGANSYFMSPDEADARAADLVETAKKAREAAKKKIVTPAKVLLGPGGQPIHFAPGPSAPLHGNGEVEAGPQADDEGRTCPRCETMHNVDQFVEDSLYCPVCRAVVERKKDEDDSVL